MDSGGCAANTSASLARLGVRTHVAGKVGSDIFGTFVLQDLERKGVDISGISRSSAFGTSKTVILPVTGDDRRFIHTFGANSDFRAADIDPANLDNSPCLLRWRLPRPARVAPGRTRHDAPRRS